MEVNLNEFTTQKRQCPQQDELRYDDILSDSQMPKTETTTAIPWKLVVYRGNRLRNFNCRYQ